MKCVMLVIVTVFWNCSIAEISNATELSEPKRMPDASLRFHAELRQALAQVIPARNPIDPNEPVNREVFQFNSWFVRNLINPVTLWMQKTLPDILKQSGSNLYENLVEPEFIITNSLAGNYDAAAVSAKRFVLNSTIGLGGLWDPAGSMGYQRTETEFTESLCIAGLDPGDFLVLPLVGPTSSKSVTLLTSFFVMEWYFFSTYLSPMFTAFIDLSTSAASLRNVRDVPDSSTKDPYLMQRANYQNYLWSNCSSYLNQKFSPPPSREIAFEERQPILKSTNQSFDSARQQ